jgi:peroxiredoxin
LPGILLTLRLVLGAVLAAAGAGKLADRPGSLEAVRGFGVPEALSAPVAALLPLVELAAAVLLVPSATAGAGALVALLLLLAFCAAITRSLIRGEAPDCHCFGALHSEPAGTKTLARNVVLAAAAAVVLAGGAGSSATGWIGELSASGLAIVVLALALAGAVTGGTAFALRLLRRNGELLLRVDALEDALEAAGAVVPEAEAVPTAGLPVGSAAPDFRLPDLDGTPVSLTSLREREQELLVLFGDPGCGPCSALMPQVAAWQREQPGGLRPVLISRGGRKANLAYARQHGLADVLVQSDREVSESFAAPATPSAVIVAVDGTVASAVHAGEDEIRKLVASRSRVVLPVHRAAPSLGAPAVDPALGAAAPDLALRTLSGQPRRLSESLGDQAALLVFWNPDCGFCQRMEDSLRTLDAGDLGLVLISTGDPDANRALGLEAPVLLDDGFVAGEAFGAAGTPSAVLIDAERRVASAVAVGAEAVLALARSQPAPVAA